MFHCFSFFDWLNDNNNSGKYDGTPVEYNGEECQMIRDDDVLLAYTGGVTMRLDTVIPIKDYVLIQIDDLSNNSNDDDDDNNDNNNNNNNKKSAPGITATRSGVVIASSVLKDLVPCMGYVVKVGSGRMASNGQYTSSPVSIGDYVKFKDYAGNDVTIEGKLYSVVKMVDILCTYQGERKVMK
jgi:chaperonin GroES